MRLYIAPFLFLLLFLIDVLTVDLTQMFFFTLFLISLIPFGILGLIFTAKGMIEAKKKKNSLNKDIGIAALAAGILIVVGGTIGLLLVYVIAF